MTGVPPIPPALPARDRVVVPDSVLFVCTQNSVRSVIAKALMGQVHGSRIYIESAGVKEGEPDGFVTEILAERGIDVSRHKPHRLEDLEDANFDVIITLSPEAHHRALEFTRTLAVEVEYWPTEDPTAVEGTREIRLDAYRALVRRLEDRIHNRFPPPFAPVV